MLWWSDDLKTGIEAIDNQHKSIFDQADEIFNLGLEIERVEFRRIISFLMKYANNHFADEEELMIDMGYKDIVEHRREHNYFVEEIYKLYLKGTEKLDQEIFDELKILIIEWLANHIYVHDKKFIDEIKKQA